MQSAKASRNSLIIRSVVMVVVFIVIVLILGQTHGPDGTPIVKNPEGLIVSMLTTAGLVTTVALPLLLRTQKDAAVAREQVANDHVDTEGKAINLRVESDLRHAELVDKMDDIAKSTANQITGLRKDVGGVRRDLSGVSERFDDHTKASYEQGQLIQRRIAALETTRQASRKTPAKPPKTS